MQAYGEEPLLKFSAVTKSFEGKKVLDSLTFNIRKGELFGLIGASGAGKTTLLRTLIGYYSPDHGKILYKGKDVTKNTTLIRSLFGFSTQESCFYEELTLTENLEYFGKMYSVPQEKLSSKIEELLKLVELSEHKELKAKQLSGGMQRRLDLAISLVHEPEILILDEPTTGLDPLLRKSMWRLIKKVNNMGVTIITSSHLLDEMEYLCNDVAMIKKGALLVKGPPKQLKSFYSKHQEVWIESNPGNYKGIINELKRKGIPIFYPRHENNKLVFYTPDTQNVLRILPSTMSHLRETLDVIRIEKPTLNEVFEALSRYHG